MLKNIVIIFLSINGTFNIYSENLRKVEQYLLKAIELDPNYVDAIDRLGLAYRNQKICGVGIMPNNTVPYINLAIVYRFQGRLEDARQTYLKAIKIDENYPYSYYGI
jgi:tetratricopeptide (TPR) repeat protein